MVQLEPSRRRAVQQYREATEQPPAPAAPARERKKAPRPATQELEPVTTASSSEAWGIGGHTFADENEKRKLHFTGRVPFAQHFTTLMFDLLSIFYHF